MPNFLMSAGARAAYQPPEEDVRSTMSPVQPDAPAAEMEAQPDPQEMDTYSFPLPGLARRQVSGHFVPGEQGAADPGILGRATNQDYAVLINQQVASSGRAAAIEAGGRWGHGSMPRTETIEPVLHDGVAFGNEFFQTNDKPIGEGQNLDAMNAVVGEPQWNAVASKFAGDAARKAAQATQYGAWLQDGGW